MRGRLHVETAPLCLVIRPVAADRRPVDDGSRRRTVRGHSVAMDVDEVIRRNGGVADARTLVRFASRRKLRTGVRKGVIVRDGHGRYSLPTARQARRAANGLSGVVTHDSAASHWGWEMKHPPSVPTVTVPRNRKVAPERRTEVHVRWRDIPPDDVWRGVTTYGPTFIDCAKSMPFDEALAIADSALRHGHLTKLRLLQLAEQVPSVGRAQCLRVAREADGRADNPFESVLRAIALDIPGLHLEPQAEIDEAGWCGRPDLVDRERRIVVEAESFEFHGRRKALKKDCARYNALVVRGWFVLRFTWEHVMLEPAYVADCLRLIVSLRTGQGPSRRATLPVSGRIPA